MKLVEHLKQSLFESDENKIKESENNAEESIKDEKSFREYAKKKFEEVFGDELDVNQMNETIEGILKDNKDAIDAGDWGKIVGVLNKSFGK